MLKHVYSREIESKIRVGISYITKHNFLESYPLARAKIYKLETIKNSFTIVGLYLFNPNIVIETLNIHLRTLTPLRSRGSDISLKTP